MRAAYGQDAPVVVGGAVGVLVAGAALLVIGLVVTLSGTINVPWWSVLLGSGLLVGGTIGAALLARQASRTNLRDRNALSRRLHVEGVHRVLDVGCGRGLLLFAALQRAPGAMGIGVELPRALDEGKGLTERFRSNARVEGVDGRTALVSADGRELPFPDRTFDLVLSRGMLASLRAPDSFREALVEMTRVLKPGGQLALVVTDGDRMPSYGEVLESDEFTAEIARTPGFFSTAIVLARKVAPLPPPPS